MTGTETGLIAAAVVLVVVAAVLAAAETALSRISRSRVQEAVAGGRRNARRLEKVLAEPPRYLNVLLLLRLATELTATVFVASVCVDRFGVRWQALLVAAAGMLVTSYVAVGVAPRTLARQHAVRVGLALAPLALALEAVLGPVPRMLILLGNALTPGKGYRDGPFTSEAELRDLVDLAEASRVIESGERAMIHSVFELGDTIVREIMVPRTEIVFIERGKTVRQGISLALRSGFSRVPVVGDGEDDVVGVVYLRDLARRVLEGREGDRIEDVMREPMFVPDTKPVDELLRELQATRVHVAIAIDEYGGTAGLVTLEDIVEEIVGEIVDESDREAPTVEQLPGGAVRVTARLPVDDLEELFGVRLPEEHDVDTVGGLLGSILGRVPIPGAAVEVDGLRLVAEGAKGRRNRVSTVLVTRRPEPAAGEPVAADGAE